MSVEPLRVFTPGWMKVMLLTGGIMFIFWGYYGLTPGDEFSFHLVSVLVEIFLGTLFVYAVVEGIINYDKENKWSMILFFNHVLIASKAKLIVVQSFV
jgi:hypothetical protein